jgi:hypothetical protein
MAAIDVGPGATDREYASSFFSDKTTIDLANPANESGKITSVELWFGETEHGPTDVFNAVVGSFYLVSGTTYACRDCFGPLDTISTGSKVTRAVDFDIEAGDFIGLYFAVRFDRAGIRSDNSGGSGVMYSSGDQTGGNAAYTLQDGYAISIYGTGTTGDQA